MTLILLAKPVKKGFAKLLVSVRITDKEFRILYSNVK